MGISERMVEPSQLCSSNVEQGDFLLGQKDSVANTKPHLTIYYDSFTDIAGSDASTVSKLLAS